MNRFKWLLVNLKIGALSFGAGVARFGMYRSAVVEDEKCLSDDEFSEVLTLSQVIPGPNLVNLSIYLGNQLTGPLFAILGLLCLALPGAFVALAIATYLNLENWTVGIVLQGFSIGSVSIFSLFCAQLLKGLKFDGHRFRILARVLIAIGVTCGSFFQVPLVWVIIPALVAGLLVEFSSRD